MDAVYWVYAWLRVHVFQNLDSVPSYNRIAKRRPGSSVLYVYFCKTFVINKINKYICITPLKCRLCLKIIRLQLTVQEYFSYKYISFRSLSFSCNLQCGCATKYKIVPERKLQLPGHQISWVIEYAIFLHGLA